jgi:hypothetical protein
MSLKKVDTVAKTCETEQAEDERRAKLDKYRDQAFIALGFTLVAVSLATTSELGDSVRGVGIAATGFFLISIFVNWCRSRQWKKR